MGSTVDVESASNGAACGLETTIGARIGLFLERRAGRWTSSLCWQVSPDDLLAAAQPLPPPNGRGPTTLLVAGRFGPARLLALDARGRTLAYGRGAGTTLLISVCPGARRMAELVQRETGVAVVIRELPGLRLIRSNGSSSRRWAERTATALRCESRDGTPAPCAPLERLESRGGSTRTSDGTARKVTLWRGVATWGTLTERTAYLASGDRGTRPPRRRCPVARRPDGGSYPAARRAARRERGGHAACRPRVPATDAGTSLVFDSSRSPSRRDTSAGRATSPGSTSDSWCCSRTAAAERASTTRRCTSCRASAGRRPGRWLPAPPHGASSSTDGCTAPPCLPGPNEWFAAFLGRPCYAVSALR